MGRAIRRREFLLTTTLAAGGLAACATGGTGVPVDARGRQTLDPGSMLALTRAARLIYPHDRLDDQVYIDVVGGLVAEADPDTLAVLREGGDALQAGGENAWIDQDAPAQIAHLRDIETTPFFQTLQAGVQARLYEHPRVWELIGYGGPSLPIGGYLDKGFDDIDWLPA